MGLKLKGLEMAFDLYKYVQELGLGRGGTHSLYLALEKLNQVEYKK